MAEVFARRFLGPESYDVNTWTPLIDHPATKLTGLLIFDLSISNTTETSVTVEIKLMDKDDKLIHYVLGPTVLQGQGIAWDSSNKIVIEPGDKLLVKASDKGVSFYASVLASLMVN